MMQQPAGTRALLAVGGPQHRQWVIGRDAGEMRVPVITKWSGPINITTYGRHLYRERAYEEPERDILYYWASDRLSEQAARLLFIQSDGPAMSRIMQAHRQ